MSKTEQRPYIGGQAVIEGVMMRSPQSFSIAVRRKAGVLVVRERPMGVSRSGAKVLAWPLVRGCTALVEAMKLGSEALRFSSQLYEEDLDAEEAKAQPRMGTGLLGTLALALAFLLANDPSGSPATEPKTAEGARDKGARLFSMVMIAVALVFFVALPQAAAAWTSRLGGWHLDVRSPAFQALTGAFKIAIIVGYLLLIRRMAEIRRVFQYHGAEHKTISTYEAGEPLTVESARSKSTLHPRCGTTFLVMVALVSIFVFTAIAPMLPRFGLGAVVDNVTLFMLKLPFLPIIAAVTFEIQRLFARYCTRGPLRALLWPGFLVQKITTIEPADDQLEVALASLRATLWRERAGEGAPAKVTNRMFADFAELSADPGYVTEG
jgi:uncharacterized protein YqhQ